MRARIDSEKCQGHGRCYTLAPEVFGEDDEGNGTVILTGPLTGEQLSAAQLAEANCPESAVILDE
ncbi:MAG TPA: ferredoxin [Mycobacteriales bacterium]|nr:ferredoxin [Mycobacteriales bacterium]